MKRESAPKGTKKTAGTPRDMTRRQVLASEAAIAVVGTATTVGVVGFAIEGGREIQERNALSKEWWRHVVYPVPAELHGQSISPLELAYIQPAFVPYSSSAGEPEPPTWPLPPKDMDHPDIPVFPETFPAIDFGHNIERLHEAKKGLADRRGVSDAGEQTTTFDSLTARYQQKWDKNEVRHMNLRQFNHLIEIESLRARKVLEKSLPQIVKVELAPILASDQNLPDRDRKLLLAHLPSYLSTLMGHLTPRLLLACILTEIMPTTERSVPLLEFIIKNGGVEYLENIPALGDAELSYGPLQLTHYAVGPGNNDSDAGGVTKLLRSIDQSDALPESLSDFTNIEQHLQAGYYFAFSNLLGTAKQLLVDRNYDQLQLLSRSAAQTKEGESTVFVEGVAALHHNTSVGRKAITAWTDTNRKKPGSTDSKSLVAEFPDTPRGEEVQAYAVNARDNYEKLGEHLRVS